MDTDRKAAPKFHVLRSGVVKNIIISCIPWISSLKQIPRSRITGLKGLQKHKASGFQGQSVQGPLVSQRQEGTGPNGQGFKLEFCIQQL